MLARVMTLRFDPAIGGFDDAPLRDFLKDKHVIAIREHFFVVQEIPYLAVMATYQLHPAGAVVPTAANQQRDDPPWMTLLSESERPLFDALRDWRAERSKQDGVPPYVLGTNRQLALMVKLRPQSLTQLSQIEAPSDLCGRFP